MYCCRPRVHVHRHFRFSKPFYRLKTFKFDINKVIQFRTVEILLFDHGSGLFNDIDAIRATIIRTTSNRYQATIRERNHASFPPCLNFSFYCLCCLSVVSPVFVVVSSPFVTPTHLLHSV